MGHVGYKHQRQTDNYTVRVGRSCHCVCVCMQTHPQLICSLFFTDTICLCFILSETTLFTLEISLSQQQLPALFFNPLFSFVVLHADKSQKSGLPPRERAPAPKKPRRSWEMSLRRKRTTPSNSRESFLPFYMNYVAFQHVTVAASPHWVAL